MNAGSQSAGGRARPRQRAQPTDPNSVKMAFAGLQESLLSGKILHSEEWTKILPRGHPTREQGKATHQTKALSWALEDLEQAALL